MACTLMNLTNLMGQFLAGTGIIDVYWTKPLEGRLGIIMLLLLLVIISVVVCKQGKRDCNNVKPV